MACLNKGMIECIQHMRYSVETCVVEVKVWELSESLGIPKV
jgi:hypothetical protein